MEITNINEPQQVPVYKNHIEPVETHANEKGSVVGTSFEEVVHNELDGRGEFGMERRYFRRFSLASVGIDTVDFTFP